jgi:hypothetical protein
MSVILCKHRHRAGRSQYEKVLQQRTPNIFGNIAAAISVHSMHDSVARGLALLVQPFDGERKAKVYSIFICNASYFMAGLSVS